MVHFLNRACLLGRSGLRFASQAPKNKLGYHAGDLVPSLAGLIPKLPANQDKKVTDMPWVKSSQSFFDMWNLVAPCMPKYEVFLNAHKGLGIAEADEGKTAGFVYDLGKARSALGGRAMNEQTSAALAEFFLCVALRLRSEEVTAAGSDSKALLEVARRSAEEDFEPFIDAARKLVADYNRSLHQALEETSPFYEVDLDLFWHANFDVVAPAELQHYLTALGHGSGYAIGHAHTSKKEVAKTIEKTREALFSNDNTLEPARRAAMMVYDKWLEASSMPVKARIIQLLMEQGLLVSLDVHESNKLLPELPEIAGMSQAVEAKL